MNTMRCYLCDSPYQVFTCIHMELHERTDSDLYVLDCFNGADELVSNLEDLNLFRKVILINRKDLRRKPEEYRNALSAKFGTLWAYLHINKITERIFDTSTTYKYIYFTCNQLCFRIIRFYCIKNKKPTKFILFDEGAGSYDGHFEKIKLPDAFIRALLFGKAAGSMDYDKYLYQPCLYYNYLEAKDSIHALPKFDAADQDYLANYLMAFSHQEPETLKKCIFFDAVREEICKSEYAFSQMQKWYDTVEQSIGPDNMTVKAHPRRKGAYPHKALEYPSTSCPIEVDYMTMDVDNLVLISVASTAVVSPKVVFDKEPVVILLCNLDKNVYELNENLHRFYHGIRSRYVNKERFMMPESISELKDCLEKAKAWIDSNGLYK